METKETIKMVVGLVVSIGVGAISGNAIRAFTPTTGGIINKICNTVGAIAIEAMVVKKTTQFVDEEIDNIAALIEKTPPK